jgi:carboxyl-terminal processing protease
LVRKRYVDPPRVAPAEMLRAGLDTLGQQVPPMRVEPLADGVELVLGGDRLRVGFGDIVDLFRVDRALLEATRFVADRIGPEVPAANLEYAAVNGMLKTLDPYSRMLDPDAWREMQTHTGGRFGGLGIRILVVEGVLTVVGVIEGSPAAAAGLRERDQILQIDGEDTLNMGIDDAVDRLRGEVGHPAKLLVRREDWPTPRELTIVRAVIQLKSVEARVLDNGVLYARVKGFQRGTALELQREIERVDEEVSSRGLVLDLRGNPGGLLDEAARLVSLFVDSGVVVATVGADRPR